MYHANRDNSDQTNVSFVNINESIPRISNPKVKVVQDRACEVKSCLKSENRSRPKRVSHKKHRRGKGKKLGNSSTDTIGHGLHFAFNNVNRVKHKVYEISGFLKKENIDVMGLAETFLKDVDGININNYKWFGMNRSYNGGGGLVF
jgi:hypothetical protein